MLFKHLKKERKRKKMKKESLGGGTHGCWVPWFPRGLSALGQIRYLAWCLVQQLSNREANLASQEVREVGKSLMLEHWGVPGLQH